ncbi:c-type cytochrome [Stappia sp. ES.058]|uniref:c-type cytochrome n=1 Tax=Stappia sp. ES.058 TaxID=1881061 RepID=UPI000879E21E|nr:c-type cytochrome [Stappia sp. ES.058]SDU40035.1 Cytochrome c553 [Stappia sp. ES.058]
MTPTPRSRITDAIHIAVATLAVLTALPFAGAQAADAQNGREIARTWCAACHVVDDAQESGSVAVPTFAEIAARPDFDEKALAEFLADPHPKMPDMALTRQEIADLGAHIARLAP